MKFLLEMVEKQFNRFSIEADNLDEAKEKCYTAYFDNELPKEDGREEFECNLICEVSSNECGIKKEKEAVALQADQNIVDDNVKPNQAKTKFIVCMDSHYVRDSQMFDTNDLSDEEYREISLHGGENENLWHDMEPTPFIAVVDAETEDEACSKAAEQHRYDKRCLFAQKI